jgi:single-strand DNA-binding protein
MPPGLNKIMVIGNLGTDPEMRYTPSGKPVTTFRLACTRSFRNDDGSRRDETEWFTIVAWERLAEQCNQFLSKGRRAYIEGRFRSRRWEGQDGQPRFVNEIVANSVLFLDQASAAEDGGQSGGEPPDADEVPF